MSYSQVSQGTDISVPSLVEHGAVKLVNQNGETLLSLNSTIPFVPASIIKIFTSAAALEILGEDYRFKTDFYLDSRQNLAIKGWGDPYLISEEIVLIARALKKRGIERITGIFLDNTSFDTPHIPGRTKTLNPYDALNGALVVNFNSLYLTRKQNGDIISAESVTPLTPLSRKKALLLEPGKSDRMNLTGNRTESLQYVGELFGAILRQEGIRVENEEIKEIAIGPDWERIYRHKSSKNMIYILQGLLKYSNNFIANQLFLTMGATQSGYPATLEKSQQAIKDLINLHYPESRGHFVMDEASGLSRTNRMTADTMIKILTRFLPYYNLLSSRRGIWSKSGTLTDVYNFAGYMKNRGKLFPFVILLNQKENNRDEIQNLLKAQVIQSN
ncbi:MAG: peptidase S13 [Proteobacteria bacterium]|nr:peptidase S13 [Pseudomonadota bacterium]